MTKIETKIRSGIPQVGVPPYGQIHAHSTGNRSSTAQNEADYMYRKNLNSGFFTHVVGNGRIIQTAKTGRGAWDVGGGWNSWTYAAVELIESHKNKADFMKDYKIYVDLLRQLAKEAGIAIDVDSGTVGIFTHDYCTRNQPNNGSDHIDPYPYLAKWGITRAQFKKDVEKGFGGSTSKPSTSKPSTSTNKITDKRVFGDNTKVKLLSKATHYQTGQGIDAEWKNKTYTVKQKKEVNQSKSQYAFLLKEINSWVLAQDLEVVKSTGSTSKGGTYTFKNTTYVRDKASRSGNIVASYAPGQKLIYDSTVKAEGYTWMSYIGASGKRRYVAMTN